jgi:hypothetical protein
MYPLYKEDYLMIHQVRISDDTMTRLKAYAEPFKDKEPEDVIRRLLDECDRKGSGYSKHTNRRNRSETEEVMTQLGSSTKSRAPRERGATIEIGGRQIQAATVPDLYKQSLTFLVDKHEDKLTKLLPFKTSAQRYLVANKPKHPGGNDFFIPVRHHDYWMEAHKDYKNAIEHLGRLASKLNVSFRYLG